MKSPSSSQPPKLLQEAFTVIRRDHDKALLERAARVVLGSSVIRVFKEDTKKVLLPHLAIIDVAALRKIKTQEAYRKWFEHHLDRLAVLMAKTNRGNDRIQPGLKWGHAAKVLCLHVREVVLCTRYFDDVESRRISKLLYIPIDSISMKGMTALGIKLPFKRIREVEKPEQFYLVQDLLGKAAEAAGVPRIWFDDIWGSRPLPKGRSRPRI